MDIHSSTHPGSRALLYPTLTRGHAAAPAVNTDTTTNAPADTATITADVPAAATDVQRVLTATQSGSAQTGDVRIETRDGDVVTVNFSRISAQVELAATSQSDNGTVSGMARASYQSAQLNYSVEGDLDKEEQAAIDHLLHRIDVIADRFFAGNVQAAFQQASHLNVRGEQIAGVAFTLENRSVQQAVSQYQSTQSDTATPVPTGTQALADYTNQVRDLVDNPGVDSVADPAATAGQLLDTNVTLRALDEFGNTLNQGAVDLLRDLLAYLIRDPQPAVVEPESTPDAESSTDGAASVEPTTSDTTTVTPDAAVSAPESIPLVA
ncbi:MAG: hypothetical protein HY941_10620 [Gammaproteobacteria bacterium]|nr:hypothetical protein [Gammaproteobacteria bacterium]